jgi:ABC-2 type transport system ATP-binding protein
MTETILRTNSLTKKYGKITALDNLSLEIKKGVTFGLLGPNGSGKTTTLGILLSVINQTSGDFTWFETGKSNKERKRIGAILEGPHFYQNFTAYQNLQLVAKIKSVQEESIIKVLKDVNLFDRKDDKFKTYSLGMKQRLAIASALLGNPEVLILDEPTNGLDPQGIADIRELIIEIAQSGKTIILASHLLDEVQKVCDEFVVLKKGKLIYQGLVENDFSQSIIIEMSAINLELLEDTIKKHPNFISLTHRKNLLEVKFNENSTANLIAQFLFDNKIVINHFALLKKNLEHQFLEILEKNV